MRKNRLRTYIFEKSVKEYGKQTINGLFRSIMEPLIQNNRDNATVLIRLKDINELKSAVKRLTFTKAKIYSFSDNLFCENITNIESEDIWESVEFLVVLSPRYSVVLLWDYTTSVNPDMSEVCLLFNTRSISEITKIILSNSKLDFSEFLKKFQPDRRENIDLNISVTKLAGIIDDLNKELLISSVSQNDLSKTEREIENYEQANENIRFICHEIKNHLSIINLYSKIAQKRFQKLALVDEIQTSLNGAITNIQTSSGIISVLLNDLKCFSKPVLNRVNISDIACNVAELTAARAVDKGVELKCIGEKDIYAFADEMKIQNTLINLVYNAIDAVDKSGEVQVCWDIQGAYVQILVKDNGAGIEEDIADRIFDVNFTTKEHGNGLGLAICKILTKEQNGELNLLMTSKKGSVFEILLPQG